MRKMVLQLIVILSIVGLAPLTFAGDINVQIKGRDDGKRTTQKQDYAEALMNAKLQAVEQAGIEITSITKVENFQLKSDLIESKAKAVLLPGFQVMDIGYQTDGTYLVVLIGKIRTKLNEGNRPSKATEFANVMLALKKVESLTETGASYNEYSRALTGLSLSIKLYGESNSPNQKVVKFLKSLEKHYYFAKGIWEDFNVVRGKKEAYNCTEAFSTPKVDRDALTARKSDNIVEMERNIDAISCLEILSLYPDTPIQEYKGSQYLSEKRILSSIWAVASADIKKLKDLQKN